MGAQTHIDDITIAGMLFVDPLTSRQVLLSCFSEPRIVCSLALLQAATGLGALAWCNME